MLNLAQINKLINENLSERNILQMLNLALSFNKCLIQYKPFKFKKWQCVNVSGDCVSVYKNKEFVCEIESALCFLSLIAEDLDKDAQIFIDLLTRDRYVFTHKIQDICKIKHNDKLRLRKPKSNENHSTF